MRRRSTTSKLPTPALRLAILAVVAAGSLFAAGEGGDPAPARTPVIVELFTSEGCSSCPPADDLLRDLVRSQPLENVEIVALAQHVDYWDSHGWTDPYSSRTATARQYRYAERERSGRVYTPQIVVDGGSPFVGGHRMETLREVMRASRSPRARLSWVEADDGLRVRVEALPPDARHVEVVVAVTESGLGGAQAVESGENRGKRLRHPSIVRRLDRVAQIERVDGLPVETPVDLRFDEAWDLQHVRLVAFVQEAGHGRIHGAAVHRPRGSD